MKATERFKSLVNRVIDPPVNESLSVKVDSDLLPTLWLLGKTGAGKSSLVRAITGSADAQVGLGFRPCTEFSQSFSFPPSKPLFRFLDTRGLGEHDYDAQADIDTCHGESSAIIVVMKLDDPEQSSVLDALKQVKKSKIRLPVLVLHTGPDLVSEQHVLACKAHNQGLVEAVVGKCVNLVVNFDGTNLPSSELIDFLGEQLPIIRLSAQTAQAKDQEAQSFLALRNEILWYAGIAGGTDILPIVGIVSVPTLQGKMLHSLAQQFGIDWGKREYGELLGALGTGFGIHYTARLGIRQLAKLVPVYGQTLGAASAAVISFSTTYALGRVASKYLFHKRRDEDIAADELKALYHDALKMGKQVAERAEKSK